MRCLIELEDTVFELFGFGFFFKELDSDILLCFWFV